MRFSTAFAASSLLLAGPALAQAQDIYVGHGLAMHGDLKYGPDFTAFDYVNPDAPKGGEVRQSAIGSFISGRPHA